MIINYKASICEEIKIIIKKYKNHLLKNYKNKYGIGGGGWLAVSYYGLLRA